MTRNKWNQENVIDLALLLEMVLPWELINTTIYIVRREYITILHTTV